MAACQSWCKSRAHPGVCPACSHGSCLQVCICWVVDLEVSLASARWLPGQGFSPLVYTLPGELPRKLLPYSPGWPATPCLSALVPNTPKGVLLYMEIVAFVAHHCSQPCLHPVSHYCMNHWLLINLSSPLRFLLFRKCPWHRVTSRTADHASMGAAHLFLVFMIVYLCIHSCTMHGSDIGRPR